MKHLSTVGMALFLVASGCAVGQEPPALTGMVKFEQGSFSYGPEIACANFTDTNTVVYGDELCDVTRVKELGAANPAPALSLQLSSFHLDVHEVTNIQFEYCVAMGWCTEPTLTNGPIVDTDAFYFDNKSGTYDSYPVIGVTREQAERYCEFVGKRLPTEFEWERAAKGGGETRRIWPAEGLGAKVEDCAKIEFNLPAGTCGRSPEAEPAPSPGTDLLYSTSTNPALKDYVLENGRPVYHLFGNVSEWTSSNLVENNTCLTDLPEDCTPVYEQEGGLTEKNQCFGLCMGTACGDWVKPEVDVQTCNLNDATLQTQLSDGDPGNSSTCYYRCVGSGGVVTPICGALEPGKVYESSDLRSEVSTTPVIKGGNVNVRGGASCSLLSSARDMYVKLGLASLSSRASSLVGFRCALDGSKSPPLSYPNDLFEP